MSQTRKRDLNTKKLLDLFKQAGEIDDELMELREQQLDLYLEFKNVYSEYKKKIDAMQGEMNKKMDRLQSVKKKIDALGKD